MNRTGIIDKEKHHKRLEAPKSAVIMEEEDLNGESVNNMREEENNKRNTVTQHKEKQYITNGYTGHDADMNTSANGENNNYGDESENEILNELEYTYESEEDLDIPTEENFLKSSTSVSGDDETMDTSFGRPRSVHFEDEKWEDGEYRIKKERQKMEHGNAWHDIQNSNSHESYSFSNLERGFEETQDLPFSGHGRLHNIKSANRESVRELLRRKREEAGDSVQQDTRRRVPSIERKSEGSSTKSDVRRHSRSTERTSREVKTYDRNSDRRVRNQYNTNEFGNTETREQHMPRSRSPKRTNGYSKGGRTLVPINGAENSDGIVLSKRDYAMYKSLVVSQNTANNVGSRDHRKVAGKMNKPGSPKLGNHKR